MSQLYFSGGELELGGAPGENFSAQVPLNNTAGMSSVSTTKPYAVWMLQHHLNPTVVCVCVYVRVCACVQEAVTKLCEFSSHYFESHGVECASRKNDDVKQLLQETLAILDRLQRELQWTEPSLA